MAVAEIVLGRGSSRHLEDANLLQSFRNLYPVPESPTSQPSNTKTRQKPLPGEEEWGIVVKFSRLPDARRSVAMRNIWAQRRSQNFTFAVGSVNIDHIRSDMPYFVARRYVPR